MDWNDIPSFYAMEIQDNIKKSIKKTTAYIDRMALSIDRQSYSELEKHLVKRDLDEKSHIDLDKLMFNGVITREKKKFIFNEYEENLIVYPEVENRRPIFLFLVKPKKNFLEILANYENVKVEATRYSIDFKCRNNRSTRFIFNTLINHAYFKNLPKSDLDYNLIRSDVSEMDEGVGSRFYIDNKEIEKKVQSKVVEIREHDKSLSPKPAFERETEIDRVRLSIWRFGKGGSLNTPITKFLRGNYIKKEINKAVSLEVLNPEKINEDKQLIKSQPLHRKIRKLRTLGVPDNSLFSKNRRQIKFLTDEFEKALENPEY